MTQTEHWQDIYRTVADLYTDPDDLRLAHILFENSRRDKPDDESRVFILGAPDDRGITHNKGRPGAAFGPNTFRKYFSRLVSFDGASYIHDLGDVPIQDSIVDTHADLSERVSDLLKMYPHSLVIVIGGGHDYAFGEIEGVISAFPEKKMGIANIDAHLDVRPVQDEQKLGSGTPFRRLWENYQKQIGYHLTFGAQKSTAASNHLAFLEDFKTKIVFIEDMLGVGSVSKRLHEELDIVFSSTDQVSINLDLDALSMAYAPGVSAPSPFGLHPEPVLQVLSRFALNPFLRTLGIYELNPQVDVNDQTARLTAQTVYHICKSRVHSKFVIAELAKGKK